DDTPCANAPDGATIDALPVAQGHGFFVAVENVEQFFHESWDGQRQLRELYGVFVPTGRYVGMNVDYVSVFMDQHDSKLAYRALRVSQGTIVSVDNGCTVRPPDSDEVSRWILGPFHSP